MPAGSQVGIEPYFPCREGEVPVFKPTMAQFGDFEGFIRNVHKYGMKFGIIKVIPPDEWVRSLHTLDSAAIQINNPIKQEFIGARGEHTSVNIPTDHSYDLESWKKLCDENTPAPAHRRTNLSSQTQADQNTSESTLDGYTSERCKELEKAYWNSLVYNDGTFYGADIPGSLFHESTECWNVANLPNLLNLMEQKIPGVNTPYLYFGMWKASFAWHVEDVDLYSINFLHYGAPKQWYSISKEDTPGFEKTMRSTWHEDAQRCDQFLRHKTCLISPGKLKAKSGIIVNRVVQYEREFVITFPRGYHSGFNLGFNCAEAVNFAIPEWLEEYGRNAKKCNCDSDSVWIDVEDLKRILQESSLDHIPPEQCEGLMAPVPTVPKRPLHKSKSPCKVLKNNGERRKADCKDTKANEKILVSEIIRLHYEIIGLREECDFLKQAKIVERRREPSCPGDY